MDFDAAMQAHASWRIRLTGYANGISREKFDAGETGRDNLCDLGKWLHGEGKAELQGVPEYRQLVIAHAEFHRHAAAIIRAIDEGRADEARRHLADPASDYRASSSRFVGLLQDLMGHAKI